MPKLTKLMKTTTTAGTHSEIST